MRFHLPARDYVVMGWAPALYVIRVDGHRGAIALSTFPGMTPQQKGTHTVLIGRWTSRHWTACSLRWRPSAWARSEVRQVEPRGNH